MRNASFVFLLLLAVPLSAAPADPALAIVEARDHINARRYGDAVQSLKVALSGVDQLAASDRDKAAAAIHFYSAVAYAGLKADAEATTHLETFFQLQPNAKLTSPDKYERHFVDLFRKAQPQPEQQPPRSGNDQFRFDSFYPGFNPSSPAPKTNNWTVAMKVLASKQEKRAWDLAESSSDQTRVIEEFWKRRDPDPETPENEFRDTFERRVAFADMAFETRENRGATSDRGRVFVLLGPPSSVRRRPLTNMDPIQIVDDTQVVNGSVEQWVYASEMLPNKIARNLVSYRFVNQRGIGDNVLQKEEPYAQQALLLAMNPNAIKNKNKKEGGEPE